MGTGDLIGKPLAKADEAVFEIEKLTLYALNPEHEDGRHKAIVFASALGFELQHAQELRALILEAVKTAAVTNVRVGVHGLQPEVLVQIQGRNGKTKYVVTAWELAGREQIPRLITLYVDE